MSDHEGINRELAGAMHRLYEVERSRLAALDVLRAARDATEKYLVSREGFREIAIRKFLETDPDAVLRIALANGIVASLAWSLSGRDLTQIPNGLYIGDLIVSFGRTHFIAMEHIVQIELIEAKTLLRKQMELLARLHEISKDNYSKAKTPNVTHLPAQIKQLYGDYSGTAHSSSPEHMILLGRLPEAGNTYTPLYPIFDENAYVALQHACLISLEFCDCLTRTYKEHSLEYDVRVAEYRTELIVLLHADSARRSDTP